LQTAATLALLLLLLLAAAHDAIPPTAAGRCKHTRRMPPMMASLAPGRCKDTRLARLAAAAVVAHPVGPLMVTWGLTWGFSTAHHSTAVPSSGLPQRQVASSRVGVGLVLVWWLLLLRQASWLCTPPQAGW
jgi:hypothetical protein